MRRGVAFTLIEPENRISVRAVLDHADRNSGVCLELPPEGIGDGLHGLPRVPHLLIQDAPHGLVHE